MNFVRGNFPVVEHIFDEEHLLGTYEAIFPKALSCGLCQLVVEALANSDYRLNNLNLEPLLIKDGRPVKVFLNSALAGFYDTRVQGLQLLKSNEKLLFTHGALKAAWKSISAVIQSDTDLVRELNSEDENEPKTFLWVDQLCIVQDDPSDKAIQIGQMNHIYSKSISTLIAAEGSHANHPLSRRKYPTAAIDTLGIESPGAGQIIRNIQGLRLLAAFPTVDITAKSVWRSRTWTM
ncbi:MAG: hypothetical protein LQ350_004594 [Teloschistes chrysophthalmus]|nr:MAG: hypothetical protein LQ350_004594 [Niorma chrysophthalma]